MTLPRITVVTPSYNQGDYIEKTIDSVLSQGYPNLEYIIIDGGSSDKSVDVIREYERHLHHWISEKDRGQSHAINKGMSRSSGSILTWLNSDDWYETGALRCFAELFQQNPGAGVVVGRGRKIDLNGVITYDKPADESIDFDSLCGWLNGGNFMQPSSAFSRAAWEACGPLSEDINIALDVDLWLKIAEAGYQFITTPDLLSSALAHPGAKTTAFVHEMVLDCARVIFSHGSLRGFEDGLQKLSNELKDSAGRIRLLEMQLNWFQKNYGVVIKHPLLRLLQPIVQRLAHKDNYWQARIPPWEV